MDILVLFKWDCGRHGELSSVFICDREVLRSYYGRCVNFGNCFGTGTEISGVLEPVDITVISEDPDVVELVKKTCGETVVGRSPILQLQPIESCFSDSY